MNSNFRMKYSVGAHVRRDVCEGRRVFQRGKQAHCPIQSAASRPAPAVFTGSISLHSHSSRDITAASGGSRFLSDFLSFESDAEEREQNPEARAKRLIDRATQVLEQADTVLTDMEKKQDATLERGGPRESGGAGGGTSRVPESFTQGSGSSVHEPRDSAVEDSSSYKSTGFSTRFTTSNSPPPPSSLPPPPRLQPAAVQSPLFQLESAFMEPKVRTPFVGRG